VWVSFRVNKKRNTTFLINDSTIIDFHADDFDSKQYSQLMSVKKLNINFSCTTGFQTF